MSEIDWSALSLTDAPAKKGFAKKKEDEEDLTPRIDAAIAAASAKHGVDEADIRHIIGKESNYNKLARSPKGAQGLMQLMPDTASELGVTDPYDIDQNIDAGTRYWKEQFDEFGTRELADAAYNAGPGAVRKYGGVPPYAETQGYVAKRKGFSLGGKAAQASEKKASGELDWDLLGNEPEFSNDNRPAQTAEEFKAVGIDPETIKKDMDESMSPWEHIGRSALSGVTIGVVPNEHDAEGWVKLAGYTANIAAGFVPMALLAATGVGSVGVLGRLAKGAQLLRTESLALKGMAATAKAVGSKAAAEGFKKAAGAATRGALWKGAKLAGIEGAAIGGGVEGVKSVINQDKPEDALVNILTGTTVGGAFGMAAAPALEGAIGAFAGRRITGKAKQEMVTAASDPAVVDQLERLGKNLTDSPEWIAANKERANAKIKELNLTMSPIELLGRPEILKGKYNKILEESINEQFLSPGAPFKSLYDSNESLQQLVGNKQYVEALDMMYSETTNLMQKSPIAQDIAKEPFMKDSKVMAKTMADVLVNKRERYRKVDGLRENLVNYNEDPSPANLSTLTDMKLPGKKGVPLFGSKQGRKDLRNFTSGNLRLDKAQVDDVVSARLAESFEAVANASILKETGLGVEINSLPKRQEQPNILTLRKLGNKISKEARTNTPEGIIKFLENKYGIPGLNFKPAYGSERMGVGAYVSPDNPTTIFINSKTLHHDTDRFIGTLVHEAKHLHDLKSGFVSAPLNRKATKPGDTHLDHYRKVLRGHHKGTDYFEFDEIKLPSAINPESIGSLKSIDEALKSAIVLNKNMTRTVMQAYLRNEDFDSQVGTIDPKNKDVMEAFVGQRLDRMALSDLMHKRKVLLREYKANPKGDLINAIRDPKGDLALIDGKIATLRKGIDAVEVRTKNTGMSPEELQKLRGEAYLVHTPSRASVSNQLTPDDLKALAEGGGPKTSAEYLAQEGDVVSASKIKNKYFDKDNPVYIKEMTDLSDTLLALSHAGYNPDWFNKTGMSWNVFANVQRKMMKELGHNNIIQTAFFDKIKKMEMERSAYKNSWLKKARAFQAPHGSKISKLTELYKENKVSAEEWASLSPKERDQIQKGAAFLKGYYDEALPQVNGTLERHNFTLVKERTTDEAGNPIEYSHHTTNDLKEALRKFKHMLNGTTDQVDMKLGASGVQNPKSRYTAGFEKQRTGSGRTDPDAWKGFEEYVEQASRVIYGTDLSRALDTAANFAPSNLGQFLRRVNDHYVLGLSDDKAGTGTKFILNEVRRRTSQSTMLGSATVVMQQLFSIPANLGVGGRDGFKALYMGLGKEGKAARALSKNISLRSIVDEGQAFGSKTGRGILNELGLTKIAKGIDKFENFAAWPLKIFDKMAASHAYLTGFNKMIRQGGNQKQAAAFGDYWAGLLQGEMTKIGQPEFMNTTMGRAFGQYMAFTMNLFSTLKDDLPQIARAEGGSRAVSMIMKTYAGMALTNEVLRSNGLPPQFDLSSFFPYWESFRGGPPGALGTIWNFFNVGFGLAKGEIQGAKEGKTSALGMRGTTMDSSMAVKKIQRDLLNLSGIAVVGQAQKTISAFKNTKLDKENPWKKGIYGSRLTKVVDQKELLKERRKNPIRKWMKQNVVN